MPPGKLNHVWEYYNNTRIADYVLSVKYTITNTAIQTEEIQKKANPSLKNRASLQGS